MFPPAVPADVLPPVPPRTAAVIAPEWKITLGDHGQRGLTCALGGLDGRAVPLANPQKSGNFFALLGFHRSPANHGSAPAGRAHKNRVERQPGMPMCFQIDTADAYEVGRPIPLHPSSALMT